jgi:hypothetical protein
MSALRLSLTVNAVGPRGDIVQSSEKLWFALQAIAGHADASSPEHLCELWPWKVFDPRDGVRAWLLPASKSSPATPIDPEHIEVDPPPTVPDPQWLQEARAGFTSQIRAAIAAAYGEDFGSLDTVNHLGKPISPELLQRNFPTRIGFLTSLPGELTRALHATVYVRIRREALFQQQGGAWSPLAAGLLLAPSRIRAGGKDLDLKDVVRETDELWRATYGANHSTAFGPGYKLGRFLKPEESELFDLRSHWMCVERGDPRYLDVERLIVDVLDPLYETRSLDLPTVQGRLADRGGAPLDADQVDALRDWWIADALVELLEWNLRKEENEWKGSVFSLALLRLARMLSPTDRVELLLAHVPASWTKTLGEVGLERVLELARRLEVARDEPRETLRAVARLAELDLVVRSIRDALTQSLSALGAFAATAVDRDAHREMDQSWAFGGDAKAGERRLALAEIALVETLTTVYARPVLQAELAPSPDAPRGSDKALRSEVSRRLSARWSRRLEEAAHRALAPLGLPIAVPPVVSDNDLVSDLVTSHVDALWPIAPPALERAAEPLPLVLWRDRGAVGRHRFVAADAAAADSALDEVTGHVLLVRRHDDPAQIKCEPWSLVSGGIVAVGTHDGGFTPVDGRFDWLPEPLAVAEENQFRDGVLRNDRAYEGRLRHAQSPLDRAAAHAGSSAGEDPVTPGDAETPRHAAYSYQGLGSYAGGHDALSAARSALRGALLRHGDHYELAVGLVDAAGGLPAEIATDQPWRLAIDKLATLCPPRSSIACFQYLRRQPVGEISVLPMPDANGRRAWPAIPRGVVLRAREWRERADGVAADELGGTLQRIPVVLLCSGPQFSEQRPDFAFQIEPPSIDEITLKRWITPRRGDSEAAKETTAEAYALAFANVVQARHEAQAREGRPAPFDERAAVHDPAVDDLGFRLQVFDGLGAPVVDRSFAKALQDQPPDRLPYRRLPFDLSVVVDEAADAQSLLAALQAFRDDPGARTLRVPLRPGWFGRLQTWPTVSVAVFARFEGAKDPATSPFQALLDLSPPAELDDRIAFQPSEVLLEAAAPDLPSASDLHEGLRIRLASESATAFDAPEPEDPGAAKETEDPSAPARRIVRVAWSAPYETPKLARAMNLVDRYEVRRERWVWRNRPVLAWDELDREDPLSAEWLRLAASGVPRDLLSDDPIQRDSSPNVQAWDARASLDRGFTARTASTGTWPRRAPAEGEAGGNAVLDVELHADDRGGRARGEYLRYRLAVHSRYAPILREGTVWSKGGAPMDRHRRIVVPHAFEEVAPPKILAIVPLTRALEDDPTRGSPATPFLVLVDQTWFREHGVGERLEARIALEGFEPGELDATTDAQSDGGDPERPYRLGPLPDHHASAPELVSWFGRLETFQTDAARPERLPIFGPFGYTLDSSPDEALANATAFVLHPPPRTGPHWAVYVRFHRALARGQASGQASDELVEGHVRVSAPSETYALYTLPSDRDLASLASARARLRLREMPQSERVALEQVDLQLRLDPLIGTPRELPGFADSQRLVGARYAYFLLVCEILSESGRDEGIPHPRALFLLGPDDLQSAAPLRDNGMLDAGGVYEGRVLEVLLNGPYADPGTSRFNPTGSRGALPLTFLGFWKMLLACSADSPGELQDAAGMIRRMSAPFAVELSGSDAAAPGWRE